MKYLVCFFMLLFACEVNPYQVRQEKLIKLLQAYEPNSSLDKSIYLITITGGCGACMQEVAKFTRANVQDNRYQFIISTDSKKAVSLDFSYEIRQSPNFLIDSKLLAQKYELVKAAHPIAYFCRNKQIVDMREITYQNADSVFIYMDNFLKFP